ncbi:MAG: ABC transporter permease [Chryseolinea sp.]
MEHDHEKLPPEWPLRCLRFFVKNEFLEEIEGDMEEMFYENVERLSYVRARRIYAWDILRLMRPVLLKNINQAPAIDQLDMFSNYFKTSIRALMKTPMSSLINIFGLSIAIGISIFVYAFAHWVNSTDQIHLQKNNVFLVTFLANRDGSLQQHGQTPRPLAEMLKNDFTQVSSVCRVEDRNVVFKYDDKVFHERVRFTDPSFLDMFTFPLKWGTPGSLADLNSVIISEEMSIKYFGDENPIGRDVLLRFDEHVGKAFKVSGVAARFPEARTISFDFLINFDNMFIAEPGYNSNDWKALINATFVSINTTSDVKRIEAGMGKYKALQNDAVHEDWAISEFSFEPLATLHQRSQYIQNDISRSSTSDSQSIVYLTIVASLMLALACFNYINIAIVSAAKRLKEIAVRKTIGATRRIVIVQFLTENIVLTFFALVLGLFLGVTFFIPGFEGMWHFNMGFTLGDSGLWIYLPSIMLFTALASGIYPALYISKFEVITILKGSVEFGKKNPVTKLFLGFQLVIACILITSAVMFTQNTAYLSKRSWGYTANASFYAEVPDLASYEKLNDVMLRDPQVLSISGSTHHLGKNNTKAVVRSLGRRFEVDEFSVDANYFETMGLQLQQGRVFTENSANDKMTVIVNQFFANTISFDSPIGKSVEIDSIAFEIVGVVTDFHNNSFFNNVGPTIFRLAAKEDYRFISLKVRPGSERDVFATLQSKWAHLFPDTPFPGAYQEEVWGNYYDEIGNHATVWQVIAFIAVLLTTLGLYGLVTINIAGRIKEFSIRKLLGAGIGNIIGILSFQYIVLFVVALLIGAPVSYALIKLLIESAYSYHMPIDVSGVTLAVLILMAVLGATIWTQTRKISKFNPVKGLKAD